MRIDLLARMQMGSAALLCLTLACLSLAPAVLVGQDTSTNPAKARAAAAQKRFDLARFENQTTYGGFTLGASFTGRSMISATRSVFVRKHLVVEVILVPPHSNGLRVSGSAFRLKVNNDKLERLPQAPGVVAYVLRNPDMQMGPRVEAAAQAGNAGVVWDSRNAPTRPKFPGDPRVPQRLPSRNPEGVKEEDAIALDAEAIAENAFAGGVITEPTVGYLYFAGDLDLDRVRKLELIFAPDEESGGQVSLKLK